MMLVDETGERVSLAAVQLAAWSHAADYIERIADITGRTELRLVAEEVRAEGEEWLAPMVAHDRELLASAC
jgi:hypothetical protein